MKKIVIILSIILIIGGALVGTMKYLELGPFALKVAKVIKVVNEDELKSIFIDIEPIPVTVFKGNVPIASIQIQIKLETKSNDKAIKIQRMLPRISDTFLKDLHAFVPRLLKEKERINVFILKQRLKLISDRNFGQGLIYDILVQSVDDTISD
jgi:flagellar basal body-associated protein FliL